ncbi:MAG: hypothetical protein V4671_19260 [Armatimonadota bacterium]
MTLQKPSLSAPFGIQMIDDKTGRGVPLVELETTHHRLFVTDSQGWAAIPDPELMNTEVYFHVRSHGCEYPKDGFGYAGVRLMVKPGGLAQVKIRHSNIAERLCRLTGAGIYADSLLLNQRVPLREPVLSGKVAGQDSALAVVYRGRMLWFWGDTGRLAYPLGNFRTTGAVATFPSGKNTAESGLDFRYFNNAEGFTREMCPSKKPGPIWIGGLAVIGDTGKEELIAHYSRMESLAKKVEQGYVLWDDDRQVFRFHKELPLSESWRFLDGHPIRVTENGTTYLAGSFCFPVVRVPADRNSVLDPTSYEAFTCLNAGGDVRRDAQGKPIYQWQKEESPLHSQDEADLVKQGKLALSDAHFLPRDAEGKPIILHGGTVTWNPWRKKWLLIATHKAAKESLLGNLVYSEADAPAGPWRRAVTIVTHNQYTFYNPVHHPFLDAAGGRIIHFEGTYTAEFSGNPRPTPRYDYNQILYRLDLADPRLEPARSR